MQVTNQWRFFPLWLIGAAWLLYRIYWIFWPGEDIAGIESVFVYYSLQLADGASLYTDFTRSPFADCQYTPLSIIFNAQIVNLFGTADNLSETYILLRSLSLLLNLLAAVLLADILRQYRAGESGHILAALLVFLCLFNSHEFGIRPDAWKTFFLCLALWFAERSYQFRSPYLPAAGFAIASVLAFWSKQDAAIWIILMLWDLYRKQKFTISKLFLFYTFLGLIFSALFFLMIWGMPLIQNLLISFQFSYHPVYLWKEVLLPALPWLLILFAFRFVPSFSDASLNKRSTIQAWIPLPLLLLAGMKWGATPVYFQEVYLFSALVIMINMPSDLYRSLVLIALITVSGIFSTQIPAPQLQDLAKLHEHRKQAEAVIKQLEKKHIDKWYLFSFDRTIIALGHSKAIFPAYETVRPEMLMNTFAYGGGKHRWQDAFPNLPRFQLWSGAAQFKPDRPVFAVVPSGQKIKSFYSLRVEDFRLESRMPGFDIYTFER
jgi:hypothetical protein